MKQEIRDQFMRIAMAQLKSKYAFYPQRLAVAAKMWKAWYEKQQSK